MSDSVTDPPPLETMVEAVARLRAAGYGADFVATADGLLRCGDCGTTIDPRAMTVDETVRFEGESNPDDEAILVAITCDCGCRGLFSSGYGASASPENTEVLRLLASRPRHG